jgi:hypothetical protein
MKRLPALLCGATLLATAACAEREPHADADAVETAAADRPETLVDTLLIEGMPEPSTARLLRSPPAFALPFSTYVPEGIAADFDPPENADQAAAGTGGDGVRFAAAFTGTPDDRAYMHVRIYARGAPQLSPREAVGAFLRTRQPQDDPVGAIDIDEPYDEIDPPAWGEQAFTFMYRGDGDVLTSGRLVVARHQDRAFHVLTHYPAEYGDGLAPRFARILEHWRWEDTGEMLQPR